MLPPRANPGTLRAHEADMKSARTERRCDPYRLESARTQQ